MRDILFDTNIIILLEVPERTTCKENVLFSGETDVTRLIIPEANVFLSTKKFNMKELQHKRDTIFLSKDDNAGIACKREEGTDCITSDALMHLSVLNIACNPNLFDIVFEFKIGTNTSRTRFKWCRLPILVTVRNSTNIIPKHPQPIQETISAKGPEHFTLKAESKRLLE